jgi:hypothetical protein
LDDFGEITLKQKIELIFQISTLIPVMLRDLCQLCSLEEETKNSDRTVEWCIRSPSRPRDLLAYMNQSHLPEEGKLGAKFEPDIYRANVMVFYYY